ncbi:putative disease resistance protein At1g50180 [Camellia sinensis]|uniref:putative disease resistance protein At1g50180 n=1 Tax=Camellia sinensis TaxID=4442 RepID=UPI0010367676|nr:putative disease resistance protein At1g50180 [Camellia sinensis]
MAEAVVSFAVERIEDLLIHKANLLYGVRSQVRGMLAELRGMRPFLKDADARQDEHKSISKLVVEIRDVAYNAEDVIETFVFKFEPRGRRGIIHILKRSASIFSEVITLYKIRSQIVTIQRLHANLPSLGLRALMEIGSATSRHLEQTFSQVGDEYFIGIEQDIEVLAAQLVSEEAEHCKVVLIWGMGGVGKTTLLGRFTNTQMLGAILMPSLGLSARKQLDEVQQQKKCLVVLDDVWSSEGFDELSRVFSGVNTKIILTTRKANVPGYQNCFILQRNLLNEVESWELFARKAFPKTVAKG